MECIAYWNILALSTNMTPPIAIPILFIKDPSKRSLLKTHIRYSSFLSCPDLLSKIRR